MSQNQQMIEEMERLDIPLARVKEIMDHRRRIKEDEAAGVESVEGRYILNN